jgi:hypothetical protein
VFSFSNACVHPGTKFGRVSPAAFSVFQQPATSRWRRHDTTGAQTPPLLTDFPHDKAARFHLLQHLDHGVVREDTVRDTWRISMDNLVISKRLCHEIKDADPAERVRYFPNPFDTRTFYVASLPSSRSDAHVAMMRSLGKFTRGAPGLAVLELAHIQPFAIVRALAPLPSWVTYARSHRGKLCGISTTDVPSSYPRPPPRSLRFRQARLSPTAMRWSPHATGEPLSISIKTVLYLSTLAISMRSPVPLRPYSGTVAYEYAHCIQASLPLHLGAQTMAHAAWTSCSRGPGFRTKIAICERDPRSKWTLR